MENELPKTLLQRFRLTNGARSPLRHNALKRVMH